MRINHGAGMQEELYAELHDELPEVRAEEPAEELVEYDDASDAWTYLSESARCPAR